MNTFVGPALPALLTVFELLILSSDEDDDEFNWAWVITLPTVMAFAFFRGVIVPVIILPPTPACRVLMAKGTTVAPPAAVPPALDVTIFCVVNIWPPWETFTNCVVAFVDKLVAVMLAVDMEGELLPVLVLIPPKFCWLNVEGPPPAEEGNFPIPNWVIVKEGCTLAAIVTGGRIPNN